MQVEILTDPNRRSNRQGLTQRLLRGEEGGWNRSNLVLIAVALALVGVGLYREFVQPPPPPRTNDDPGRPQPVERTRLPQYIQELDPREFGRMIWVDELDQLYQRVRVIRIVESGGTLIVRLAVCQADGLWRPMAATVGTEIPGTNLLVARVDSQIAFAQDLAGNLYRLFHPSQWETLHAAYGFPARSPFGSDYWVALSTTRLWTLPSGMRTVYWVELTLATGERIPDARFAELVPLLEEFAIMYEQRLASDGDRTTSARDLLRDMLAARRIRDIYAENEQVDSNARYDE